MLSEKTHAGRAHRLISIEQPKRLFGSPDYRPCPDNAFPRFAHCALGSLQLGAQFRANQLVAIGRNRSLEKTLDHADQFGALSLDIVPFHRLALGDVRPTTFGRQRLP